MAIVKSIKTNIKTVTPVKKEQFPYYENDYLGEEGTILANCLSRVDENDDIELIIKTSSDSRHTLNILAEALPHCCGVYELGKLNVSLGFPIEQLTKVLDTLVTLNKGYTLLINTNGISYSIIFEKALLKCKYFTLVKTFKNHNSKNTIKMWVSNND